MLYSDVGKSATVIFYNYEPDYYYYLIYLNPYTAEVLEGEGSGVGFFQLGSRRTFLFMVATGNRTTCCRLSYVGFCGDDDFRNYSLVAFEEGSSEAKIYNQVECTLEEKNYDLHNVLGFYMTWVGIILAVTGLVWGFEWFAKGYYTVTGGEKSMVYVEPVSDTTAMASLDKPAIDRVWDLMRTEHPTAKVIEVHIPETNASVHWLRVRTKMKKHIGGPTIVILISTPSRKIC